MSQVEESLRDIMPASGAYIPEVEEMSRYKAYQSADK